MKKSKLAILSLCMAIVFSGAGNLHAQNDKDIVIAGSKTARSSFIKTDGSMKHLFDDAYAYAIFPNIGKGAVVVGGAEGNGAVFEKGKTIGTAKMAQVTVGAQVGGQSYREVIFFENKEALDRFRNNKVEFSGQVSAVAVKAGASATAKYRDGVSVFSESTGGLMAEASIGGQKFTYRSL
jgi:lipid-binding SYLF domain-containing protein